MKSLPWVRHGWAIPLCLVAAACVNEAGNGDKPVTGTQKAYGRFLVTLKPGYTTIQGTILPKPSPSPLLYKQGDLIGGCRLITPTAPFCDPGCVSGFICVENNKCQEDPKAIGVGTVTAKGIKTKTGGDKFNLKMLVGTYQTTYLAPPESSLAFPPFAQNEVISFTSAGDSTYAAFTLSAQGISPLQILNDSLTLVDGKPLSLKWVPPSKMESSTLSISVDISHHGGLKGKIECQDIPDSGSFEIAATLVDQLKALGISGYPKIEVTRKASGKSTETNADVVIESNIDQELHIPGLISCEVDEDCPSDQECQQDRQCKAIEILTMKVKP